MDATIRIVDLFEIGGGCQPVHLETTNTRSIPASSMRAWCALLVSKL